jgi:hypothetical protein
MADIAIILDNAGNDIYIQNSREYLTNPIKVDLMRIILTTVEQIGNIIKIRNSKSVGTETNRDISIGKYISAMDKTNLIIDVPINPPMILNGQTSFQIELAANSEMDLIFYFDQANIESALKL